MTYNPNHLETDEEPPEGTDGANVLGTTGNQASTTRPAVVMIEVRADPAALTAGEVNVNVDLDDGGATDHTGKVFAAAGLGEHRQKIITFYLPAGGTYDVANTSDPDGANTATAWEWIP